MPLRGAHLWARVETAGRRVEEESHNEAVALCDEEAAELVEPEALVDRGRCGGEEGSGLSGDGQCVVRRVMVMKRGEVLL